MAKECLDGSKVELTIRFVRMQIQIELKKVFKTFCNLIQFRQSSTRVIWDELVALSRSCDKLITVSVQNPNSSGFRTGHLRPTFTHLLVASVQKPDFASVSYQRSSLVQLIIVCMKKCLKTGRPDFGHSLCFFLF